MRAMNAAVLVTGGAGFVGSHACKALAKTGIQPITFDNLSSGHRWAVRWGPIEVGDLSNESRLDEVVRRYKPIAVMHFASLIEAGKSVDDPMSFYTNNVCNTLSLLQAMRRNGVDRLVFSSSAAVYGNPRSLPIAEDHPKNPINPYGSTKRICEKLLAEFAVAYGLKSVSLRYFNAAGADPDGEIGEAHDPETHLIPRVLQTAIGERPSVSINGNNYPTYDGTCIRDFVHVSDLAEAHRLALDRTALASGAVAYNLGSGQGHSVREVVDMARRVTGRSIAVRIEERRPGDPASLVADPGAAHRELGWSAARSGLQIQITDAWNWFLNRYDRAATSHRSEPTNDNGATSENHTSV